MSYWLLFISAFGAATLLPLQSEAVFITLLIQGLSNPFYLILVATIGNVLGSCVNWWLGLKIEHFKDKKWFPVSEQRLAQAQQIYHKYGFYSLLSLALFALMVQIMRPLPLQSCHYVTCQLHFQCFENADFFEHVVLWQD